MPDIPVDAMKESSIVRAYRLAAEYAEEIIRSELDCFDIDSYRIETCQLGNLHKECIERLVESRNAQSYETDYGDTVVIITGASK